MNFHQIVFMWEHFEKKFSKICFQHKVTFLIFGKRLKSIQLWQYAKNKPLNIQSSERYLWKDDIHIFLKTPWGLKYAHRLGHNGPGKIMAPCGQRQKVSDTSISSSLSLAGPIRYCDWTAYLPLDMRPDTFRVSNTTNYFNSIIKFSLKSRRWMKRSV